MKPEQTEMVYISIAPTLIYQTDKVTNIDYVHSKNSDKEHKIKL